MALLSFEKVDIKKIAVVREENLKFIRCSFPQSATTENSSAIIYSSKLQGVNSSRIFSARQLNFEFPG